MVTVPGSEWVLCPELSEPVRDEREGVFFLGEVSAVPGHEPEAMIHAKAP